MENQDKLYSQFKNAAENLDAVDFPNMDKVWNRVEEKLDSKVLKKQNKLWKKIAVAASILLIASVGYQLLKPNTTIKVPQNNIVILDTLPDGVITSKTENPLVLSDSSSVIRKDAKKILENAIKSESKVAVADAAPIVINDYAVENVEEINKDNTDDKSSGNFAKRKFNAIGVQHDEEQIAAKELSQKRAIQMSQKTEEPLLIIDNKAITTKNASNYKKIAAEEMSKINSEEIQNVVYLKEPLYVIDGKQYSEKEMFGPNPTSPYSPLSEQEIKSTVVLQGNEAIALYGKKGEKGVLIITTKNGKPSKKIVKNLNKN